MEDILWNVPSFTFDVERALEEQIVLQNLPFPNMDSNDDFKSEIGTPLCNDFFGGHCSRDILCPLRHLKVLKGLVCKHWLRGLCKKGDECESFHEYDHHRMPQCYYFAKFNHCSNKDCPFLHGDVDAQNKNCPFYDRGFCSNGKACKYKHVFRPVCMNYICGFCIDGPNCKNGHPKFEALVFEEPQTTRSSVVCHACNEPGHKSTSCPLVEMFKNKARMEGNLETANLPPGKRPLELVTCFKCRERGHYANKCPLSVGEVQKLVPKKEQEAS